MSTRGLIITTVILLCIFGGIAFYFLTQETAPLPVPSSDVDDIASAPELLRLEKVIGRSVEGRDIRAVTFGEGETHLLFVGGMHGGYEWNSSLLAYDFIDYVDEHPEIIPEDLSVTVIPDINPDGTAVVTGVTGKFTLEDVPDPTTRVADGRFNARGVDLNRNFDCKWAPESSWKGETVSAGTAAFSEPEAQALRDFVLNAQPKAVVFWHSQANNVYASECEDGVLPDTLALMKTYAEAAGYGEVEKFDAYPITGDAEGWLASLNIPAVTVEMQGFQSTEWEKNLAGIDAVLSLYSFAK